jgi:hypothetical protein
LSFSLQNGNKHHNNSTTSVNSILCSNFIHQQSTLEFNSFWFMNRMEKDMEYPKFVFMTSEVLIDPQSHPMVKTNLSPWLSRTWKQLDCSSHVILSHSDITVQVKRSSKTTSIWKAFVHQRYGNALVKS